MSWRNDVEPSFLKKFVLSSGSQDSGASVSEIIVTDFHRSFNLYLGRVEYKITLYNVRMDDTCCFKCWFCNSEFYYKREW